MFGLKQLTIFITTCYVILNDDNFVDDMMAPPETVTLVAGDTSVGIRIRALLDRVLENNESLTVSAYPPSDDGRHCNTTFTIVDDSKLFSKLQKCKI